MYSKVCLFVCLFKATLKKYFGKKWEEFKNLHQQPFLGNIGENFKPIQN